MNPVYIILEGPDGGGHSLHVECLALSLRKLGVRARAWSHPLPPEGAVGLARVHHYIAAREAMEGSCDVVVMDRGPWAGVAHALAVEAQDPRRRDSGLSVALVDTARWEHAHVIYLFTDGEELDRRLAIRGQKPVDAWHERRAWTDLAHSMSWPVVNSAAPPEVTALLILGHALKFLGPPKETR
jgi:thymidylate kinase